MHYFEYKNGQLYCEGMSIESIAEKVGTPFLSLQLSYLNQAFHCFR